MKNESFSHLLRIAWERILLLSFARGFQKCCSSRKIHPFLQTRKHPGFLNRGLKNGTISPSQYWVGTSSLAQFCMRIPQTHPVLEHSSIYSKRGPPCFLNLGLKSESYSPSQNCTETFSLAQLCTRSPSMLLGLENSSISSKKEPPCFLNWCLKNECIPPSLNWMGN